MKYDIFSNEDVISKDKARQLNPLVLAFVGDAVHSLYVRKRLSLTIDCKTNMLQKNTSKVVKASSQSKQLEGLKEFLNEDEMDIARRARNTKTNNIAKNSTLSDYKRSTSFEAVMGYLYLTGQHERVIELLNKGFDIIEVEDDN